MATTDQEFAGIPMEALDFYDDLEADNTKSFWAEHAEVYLSAVKQPITALTRELEAEFGPAKVFRPFRDVRFAKDKTPYKTHQGAFVALGPATGWYVEVSAAGVRVGVGFYDASSARLSCLREAISSDVHGPVLQRLVNQLVEDGWTLGGDRLKTTPRGFAADHPRIELLRHKSMTLAKSYGFDPVIHTRGLLDQVRADWRQAGPFVEWVDDHSGE